jgi:hypothetical protein
MFLATKQRTPRMKTTRRHYSGKQAPSTPVADVPSTPVADSPQQAEAPGTARKMPDTAGVYVIRAARSPYGPRPRWGQVEYAQGAIAALYRHGSIPRNVNVSALTRRVQDYLDKDSIYRAAGFSRPVSRQTVLRALELLRKVNP